MALSDISTAGKAIKSILGGKPPDRAASLRLRKDLKLARQGDPAALQRLEYRARTQGSKFKNINRKAAKYYELVMAEQGRTPQRGNQVAGYVPPNTRSTGWEASAGAAGSAGSSSTPQYLPQGTSSPSAPRAQRPCAYGPRGTDGRCPPKPKASQLYSAGPASRPVSRSQRPCAYGPRGADGYCPKKPASSRTRQAAERRLEATATKAVTSAAGAAIKYAPAVLRFAGQAALVVAAGAAAYWITSQLMRIRGGTVADLRFELANQYRAARRAYAAQYGRNLSPSELADLSAWYKRKDAELRAYGPDSKKVPGTFRWE